MLHGNRQSQFQNMGLGSAILGYLGQCVTSKAELAPQNFFMGQAVTVTITGYYLGIQPILIHPAERKDVLALAQARKVDVILVTELTRWGRSMMDPRCCVRLY
jgi:hypothetical protein